MSARHWPVALALLAIVILGSYLLYTEQLVREFRTEAEVHKRMYALVQQGLLSSDPDGELQALSDLQFELTQLGIPLVALSTEGQLQAAANLPFEADLVDPVDRARVLEYVDQLDARNDPVVTPYGSVHFGSPPIIRRLRWAAILQMAGALLLIFVGYVVVRGALRAERERMWSAMARELAHQMGTPLSSLKGWQEMLRLPPEDRAQMVSDTRLAREVGADLDRLERVSRRFELIGKPPALSPVKPGAVVRELEQYVLPRLPKGGGKVELRIRISPGLPAVEANQLLLVWALENCVKNALDALAGRGGWIRLAAFPDADGIGFLISDNGPGVAPSIQDRLFEAGVSTKPGGWGVGLSLARRIVEDVHSGKIRVQPRPAGGTRFEILVPISQPRRRFSRAKI